MTNASVARPTPRSAAAARGGAGIEGSSSGDRVYRWTTTAFAMVVPILLCLIAWEVFAAGWPALAKFGIGFFTQSAWDPVNGNFGAAPAIFGTIVSSLLALIIATPLAVGVAIFLSEFAPRALRQPVAFFVDLLAAIPSVVYGLWGIFVLMPFLRADVMPFIKDTLHLGSFPLFSGPAYGPSMLAAGVILAIMVLPYISAVSREVLIAVPRSQREAALALGATRWEMIWDAVLPYARSGHHRRRHSRAGPRARRDDGRDDGHRQPARDRGIAVRAGLHHGLGHRERVQRSDERPAHRRRSWRWAPVCSSSRSS